MTIERPVLNRYISMADFRSFFWPKEELIEFCTNYDLDTIGNRDRLTERIESFLLGGSIPEDQARKIVDKSSKVAFLILPDSIIVSNKGSNQEIKSFYKNYFGSDFLPTIAFVEYIRSCVGLTWQQAGAQWQASKTINAQVQKSESPNFVRRYLDQNKNRTLKEAFIAWKLAVNNSASLNYSLA